MLLQEDRAGYLGLCEQKGGVCASNVYRVENGLETRTRKGNVKASRYSIWEECMSSVKSWGCTVSDTCIFFICDSVKYRYSVINALCTKACAGVTNIGTTRSLT